MSGRTSENFASTAPMTGARHFPATSQKILIIAHDLNPSYGSEAGRASLWVKLAGSHFPLLVVTDVAHRKHILAERYPGVEFFFVEVSATVRRLARRLGGAGYAAAYRVFAS